MLWPAIARAETFPPLLEEPGLRLALNGTGARRFWGVEVYRAALYLEHAAQDAAMLLEAAPHWRILLRYIRAVPANAARRAWLDSYAGNAGTAPPAALLEWVRAAEAGDLEWFRGGPQGALLSGPGRADATLPGAAAARNLLAAWIGPAPPSQALKQGLLGKG